MAERQWMGTTFGNGWMHKALIRLLHFTPVYFLYLFTDIFIVPFCLIFNKSRKTAWDFYRRHLGFGFFKSCHLTFRNHCLFAQVVIDRFAMYAGKGFNVQIEGTDYFKQLEKRPEGFIQLSSHIGNYEIAGYSLVSPYKQIHAIVYSFEKESVMKGRDSMFTKTNVSMIALQPDMSHLFEIDKALCAGDIISFPADRHMEGGRCITADFLGKQARFPQGPFSVATMRGVEALAVNVMKEGLKKYRIFLTWLPYDKQASRKEQIRQLSEAYVRELERLVRLYPAQWYNFFDFWAS
ncbi:MAG: lysophospholipid acyltransferase family protein [Bacteroidales bacterium]|nr:lysophospholipid acyltransferase family protein [Bacteroidales bacterium]